MRVKSRGSYATAQHISFDTGVVSITSGEMIESTLDPSSIKVYRVVIVFLFSTHTLSSKVYSVVSIDSD